MDILSMLFRILLMFFKVPTWTYYQCCFKVSTINVVLKYLHGHKPILICKSRWLSLFEDKGSPEGYQSGALVVHVVGEDDKIMCEFILLLARIGATLRGKAVGDLCCFRAAAETAAKVWGLEIRDTTPCYAMLSRPGRCKNILDMAMSIVTDGFPRVPMLGSFCLWSASKLIAGCSDCVSLWMNGSCLVQQV